MSRMGSIFPTANRFSSAVIFYGVRWGRKPAVHAKPSKIHNAGGSDGDYMPSSARR